MKTKEMMRYAQSEGVKRTIRHVGIWAMLIISLLLMVKTSSDPLARGFEFLSLIFNNFQTGNSIWFTLASGVFVSSVFTLLIVVLPNKRRKHNTKKALLHIPSFILEGEEGGFFTWSKNIIFCDPDKCTLDNILKYKEKVFKNS